MPDARWEQDRFSSTTSTSDSADRHSQLKRKEGTEHLTLQHACTAQIGTALRGRGRGASSEEIQVTKITLPTCVRCSSPKMVHLRESVGV